MANNYFCTSTAVSLNRLREDSPCDYKQVKAGRKYISSFFPESEGGTKCNEPICLSI